MSDEPETYSIQLRLRREVVEDAYVSVFVDEKVLKEEDGSFKIDFEKLVAEAVRMSADHRIDWQPESIRVEVHPLQAVKPEERTVLDSSEVA